MWVLGAAAAGSSASSGYGVAARDGDLPIHEAGAVLWEGLPRRKARPRRIEIDMIVYEGRFLYISGT